MAEKFDLKAIISAVDKVTPTLKGIRRSVRLTHKTIKDIGRAGKSLTTSVGLPAGLAFGAVAYGAVRAARATMDYASGIQDAADRTNSSIQGFQVLSNLLAQVGGEAEDAEKAFDTFNKGVANAAAGADASFAGLLKKMKIPLRDAQGNLRSLEQVLPDVADAFAANRNPAIQARMAMELFGKSGKKLIPVLNGGRQAYTDWIKEQQRLGLIVSNDAVAGMDNLGDSVSVLNLQMKSQLVQSLAALVPVIQPIIKDMSEWIAKNKEWLRAEIVSTLKGVAQAIREVDWKQVAADIKDAGVWVRDTVKKLGGLKTVLIGLGVLFIAGPVASILSIVGAIWRFTAGMVALAGGWRIVAAVAVRGLALITGAIGRVFLMLLANPIGLVIAGIAAAAFIIYKNWDSIKKWFTDFFGWMAKKVKYIADLFKSLIPDWVRDRLKGDTPAASPQPARPSAPSPLIRSGGLQIAGGRQQLTGDMTVRFENAPPGMRVNPGKTNQPGVSMNPDVGYRRLAMGF